MAEKMFRYRYKLEGKDSFQVTGIMFVQLCSDVSDSYAKLRTANRGLRRTPQSFVYRTQLKHEFYNYFFCHIRISFS
jgi:hypothetical protein